MAERFLVVKLADLGDALTATPALRALRDTFPTAWIDALVTSTGAAALRGLDSVNDLIVFDKAQFDRPRPTPRSIAAAARLGARLWLARYDRVFLLHHLFTRVGRLKYRALLAATGAPWRVGLAESRPPFLTTVATDRGYGARHEADYWLDVVALVGARPAASPRFEIAIDASARATAERILSATPSASRRVALFPGAGAYSPGRRWAPDNYVEVGRQIVALSDPAADPASAAIFVVGTSEERGLAELVCRGIGPGARNLAGQTDLKTLAALLARCDLFVGNDGGATHVAVAAGVPVIAIFGPSNHVSWGPYGAAIWGSESANTGRSIVFWQDLPCAPCLYRGFLPGTARGCRAHDCLTLTTPDEVMRAVKQLLTIDRP